MVAFARHQQSLHTVTIHCRELSEEGAPFTTKAELVKGTIRRQCFNIYRREVHIKESNLRIILNYQYTAKQAYTIVIYDTAPTLHHE